MTDAARGICRELARRYPSSAAARGGTPLRLSVDRAFPSLASSPPDARESFLDAAEFLEARGLVSLSWKRFRQGDELSGITLLDPPALFALLEQAFPPDEMEQARAAALDAARRLERRPEHEGSRSYLLWLADNLRPTDTVAEGRDGAVAQALSPMVADFGRLLGALPAVTRNGALCGTTLRALSIELFSDSKRIEALVRDITPLLGRARRAGVAVPDLSALDRTYPETLVSGPLAFVLDNGDCISNPAGVPLGVPLGTAGRIQSIGLLADQGGGSQPRLLTVENLETFYALASRQDPSLSDAIMYCGGHPNRAVRFLLAACARSGFSLAHAGDLDPDGILILQELSDCAGARVGPLRMDAATFDAHVGHARSLDGPALKRASAIRADTRALPGIAGLLDRILSTGKGVEQEIISYWGP